jgi:ribose 5-phosphate isomerase A
MDPKQRAGDAAITLIQSGMVVGLGTGSTADCFLIALSRAIASGKLTDIRGVPTSRRSETRAAELGIPLSTLALTPHPDVTVDGADEVAPNLDVIKGLGGALLREKIVAQNTRKFVIIADSTKTVQTLGTHSPLPVEVATFGHEAQAEFLRSLGCQPQLRRQSDGEPFVTDNSNYIYDCKFNGISDPRALQLALMSRAGIVGSGMFLGMANLAMIGSESGVTELRR